MTMQQSTELHAIGTVASEEGTPSYERVRVKLKAGCDVKPGDLLRIPTNRGEKTCILITRVRSAYENNPHENAANINVRDSLGLDAAYPPEVDSTTIYRVADTDVIEEVTSEHRDGHITYTFESPQTLAVSGSLVYEATPDEVIHTLGLEPNQEDGLFIGKSVGGSATPITLKRRTIQRHLFVCGTTGSGKSYAMGVIAEELILKHHLPVIFLDTQDEYTPLVEKLGGNVVIPGKDFNIRISSLTDRELIDFIPTDSYLQKDIITAAFLELQSELAEGTRQKFVIDDLVDRIGEVGPTLTNSTSSIELSKRRTAYLKRLDIFGEGVPRANWPKLMVPCLSIRCKTLTSTKLQTVATALLRELQDLRLRGYIPPYLMVIDEAHLFVPQGEGSPCKQIIREGVRIGRHHGIALALLTQSPVDIDKGVIRQCNTRLVFALEPDQLDAIRGVKADSTEEMLNALPKMPQGRCLLSGTYETVKHTIPVQIRRRITPDSEGGSTPDIFNEMLGERWRVYWEQPNNGSEG